MAQVTTGGIYECDGHDQEGHELAGGHPVIIVGKQSLIDNQGIAIAVPLTSTPPSYPVHWAVEIEAAKSYAYVRHLKSVHITKSETSLGALNPRKPKISGTDSHKTSTTTPTSAPQPWGNMSAQEVCGPRPYQTLVD